MYYPLFPGKQMSKDVKQLSQGEQLISWGKLGQMQILIYWLSSHCALLRVQELWKDYEALYSMVLFCSEVT